MVGWVCSVGLQDGVLGGLRERLGFGDMVSLLQQSRLRWCGNVLWWEESGWVRGCVECEVKGARPGVDQRGLGERLWRGTVGHVD